MCNIYRIGMRAKMRLDGRIAIVTGGGQGIGRSIVLRLAREGAAVVIADINEPGSRETAALARADTGREPRVVPTDVAAEDQVAHLAESTLAIDGRIDILVNNAGIPGPLKSLEDVTLEEWDETIAVNLRGMFLCCKHVLRSMKRQRGGSIVNISSMSGKRPLKQRTPYAAAKMAVIGLTRTLAAETGPWNIRVNAVCPGPVAGPRQDRVVETIMKATGKTREEAIAERVASFALGTFVQPEDVAAAVAFLCSSDACRMTGQDINVSQGTVIG